MHRLRLIYWNFSQVARYCLLHWHCSLWICDCTFSAYHIALMALQYRSIVLRRTVGGSIRFSSSLHSLIAPTITSEMWKAWVCRIFQYFTVLCRCKRWITNTRRADLDKKTPDDLHKSYFLCGKHFEDTEFMNALRNRLKCNAIPTVFEVSTSEILHLTSLIFT